MFLVNKKFVSSLTKRGREKKGSPSEFCEAVFEMKVGKKLFVSRQEYVLADSPTHFINSLTNESGNKFAARKYNISSFVEGWVITRLK